MAESVFVSELIMTILRAYRINSIDNQAKNLKIILWVAQFLDVTSLNLPSSLLPPFQSPCEDKADRLCPTLAVRRKRPRSPFRPAELATLSSAG